MHVGGFTTYNFDRNGNFEGYSITKQNRPANLFCGGSFCMDPWMMDPFCMDSWMMDMFCMDPWMMGMFGPGNFMGSFSHGLRGLGMRNLGNRLGLRQFSLGGLPEAAVLRALDTAIGPQWSIERDTSWGGSPWRFGGGRFGSESLRYSSKPDGIMGSMIDAAAATQLVAGSMAAVGEIFGALGNLFSPSPRGTHYF